VQPIGLAASIVLSSAAYFALAVVFEGGLSAFFSHPPLVAMALVFLALVVASLFTEGNLSKGVREDRGNRWVIGAIILLGLLGTILAPYTDRVDVWTLDGDTVRWIGVVLLAAGGTLRLAPVYVLGRRFSGLVAIQPGHLLVTTGLYAKIRHPSYLGLLVTSLGWGLAFRSGVGVLLAVLTIPPLLVRIRAEEAMLLSEFGAEYEAYRARTARLIPGLY
jgi:protein-S-isoprenylcysteine O-methyltransferase Ste14